MNRLYIYLALTGFCMTGCGSGFLGSGIDSKRDEYGNVILQDTQNNWANWIMYMDLLISDELAGKQAPGGIKTWEEFWHKRITLIGDGHQENPQKYIDYIVEKRRQVGLPLLKSR